MPISIGEKLVGWSADKNIFEKSEHGGVVVSLLSFALKSKLVDFVVALKKRNNSRFDGVLTITNKPEEVVEAMGALHCVTPNIAKFVKKYLDGLKDVKVAVVVKPCDAKAIVELVKRNQINPDNLLMVGVNCSGTFNPVIFKKMLIEEFKVKPEEVVDEEIKDRKLLIKLVNGKILEKDLRELEEKGYGRRENCRYCETPIPRMADLAVGKWGVEDKKASFIEICSEKGANLVKTAVDNGIIKIEKPSSEIIEERERKCRESVEDAKYWQNKILKPLEDLSFEDRLRYWFSHFNRCVKCFGCRDSCPICYCVECILEARRNLVKAGEIPPEKLFPAVRITHVVDSCVGCGQCQDACQMEIPLIKLLYIIKNELKPIFKYEAGLNIEEKPPLTTTTDKELNITETELKPDML